MKLTKLILLFSFLSTACIAQKKFTGTFSNGFKGAKLSFTLSENGKEIKNFIFDGYWRCGGSTEHIKAGPEKSFNVVNGKIQGTLSDPENGGSSAFRFSLEGQINGKAANGTFRMSITGLRCDTYVLNWAAEEVGH